MEKPIEDLFQDIHTIEYKNAESRLVKQAEVQERKLFAQLTDYFDQKFDKVVNMMQDSLQHCERRVDTLETKLNLFQQPVNYRMTNFIVIFKNESVEQRAGRPIQS